MSQVISKLTEDVSSILSIDQIRSRIDKADSAYYRNGSSSIMTDEEYDALKIALRKLDPDDERLVRVGVPYSPEEIGSKVKHKVPMGSLDNVDNGIAGYDAWYHNIVSKLIDASPNPTIMASLKIDGASICASYEDGKLVRVVSRGNGEVGEDITANAVNFQYLPTVLPSKINCEVRGEAILYKKDFDIVCAGIPVEERSNPRNVGNGILGRHDGTDSNFIRLLAFNIWSDGVEYQTEYQKFQHLTKLGFTVVPHVVCDTVDDLHDYYAESMQTREDLEFEIDGIVVCLNKITYHKQFITNDIKTLLRPKFARAIKPEVKSAVTELIDINISIGHSGAIIPTGVVRTVNIGGVDVTNVFLNNWDEVKRFELHIGSQVEICRSGDVIPKLISVVSRDFEREPISEPTECPSCKSPTTRLHRGKVGAVTYCSNTRCKAAAFEKITHWIGSSKKGVGILDIGDTMLQALWDQNIISDPADLYTLTVDKLKDIVLDSGIRIGESRAITIINNINSKRNLSLSTFLGSLGIDLLGRRRVEQFVQSADGKLDTIEQWLDPKIWNTISFIGLGDSIREAIKSGIDDNRELIKKLFDNGVTIESAVKEHMNSTNSPELPLAGITMCWTGTRELIDEAKAAGVIVKSGISKGLDILVQLDPLSKTVKTQKAEALGTQIISVEYLRKLLLGQATRKDLGL